MKNKYAIEVEIPQIPIAKKGNMEIHPKAAVELKEQFLGQTIIEDVQRIMKEKLKIQTLS